IWCFEPPFKEPNQLVPSILLKLSFPIVWELAPPDTATSKLFPVASFVKMSTFTPATSPPIVGLNVLLTLMLWITSEMKKSKEIFLYNGSSEGNGNPFSDEEL